MEAPEYLDLDEIDFSDDISPVPHFQEMRLASSQLSM